MLSSGNLEYNLNNRHQSVSRPKVSAIPVYIGLLTKSGVKSIQVTNIATNKELSLISDCIRQHFKESGIFASRINNHFGRVDFYKLGDWSTDILEVSEGVGEISIRLLDINSVSDAVNRLKAY